MTTTTSPEQVRQSWVPYAAIVAGSVLLLKAALIIGSGGDAPGGLTSALYLAGLLLALAAAVGSGLQQPRGRRALVAVGLVLLLLAYVMALSDAVAPLFSPLGDEEYIGDEGPVGLLGVVLLGLGALRRR